MGEFNGMAGKLRLSQHLYGLFIVYDYHNINAECN